MDCGRGQAQASGVGNMSSLRQNRENYIYAKGLTNGAPTGVLDSNALVEACCAAARAFHVSGGSSIIAYKVTDKGLPGPCFSTIAAGARLSISQG